MPARWWHTPDLPSSVTEHSFKFNDYYLSTGRPSNQFCQTIEEAIDEGPNSPIKDFDPSVLLNSFPEDKFDR